MSTQTPFFDRVGGRIVFTAAALLVAVVLVGGEAWGCPNCKDAVDTSDPDGLNLARGYFYSILIMLAMPFALVGSFGVYVWREMQRQKHGEAPPGSWLPEPGPGEPVGSSRS